MNFSNDVIIILNFLNIVLNTGFIPTEWCLGIDYPLFKNNGSVSDPNNYRGITKTYTIKQRGKTIHQLLKL